MNDYEVIKAITTLGITGDTLFDRIRADIERGLIQQAREHLNFVDKMIKKGGDE